MSQGHWTHISHYIACYSKVCLFGSCATHIPYFCCSVVSSTECATEGLVLTYHTTYLAPLGWGGGGGGGGGAVRMYLHRQMRLTRLSAKGRAARINCDPAFPCKSRQI